VSDDRDRIGRLIDFLADLDARRNPPVYDIGRYGIYLLREADLPSDHEAIALDPYGGAWLTVDFVELPAPPVLPDELTGLIDPADAREPRRRPGIESARPTVGDDEFDGGGLDDDFDDEFRADVGDLRADPELDNERGELVAQAHTWIDEEWTPWSERHQAASAAKMLYRDLFEQRDKVNNERESIELVWGFGRLRWTVDAGYAEPVRVDHPLLTVPAEIDRDQDSGRISVRPADAAVVDTHWLANLPVSDRAGYLAVRQAVEGAGVEPWSTDDLADVIKRLTRAVDQEDRGVTVESEWVLYVRRRRPDYQGFLDHMRELYRDEGCPIPEPLRALVSGTSSFPLGGDTWSPDDGEGAWGAGHGGQLLLPLPTNEEQQRIVRLAETRSGVTVQGPPGTGKSHTIANIISHYVAQGRRVLVVAEKEQALRTLAEKVPAAIRDLTVSVLGADEDGRRSLESSIRQIQTRVTGLDKAYADQRIKTLRDDLDALDRRVAIVTSRLMGTREAEVATLSGIWEAGENPTRAEAARWVAEREGELGYVDDQIDPETPAPLTVGELVELRELIVRIGFARAAASAQMMPDPRRLPAGAQLAASRARAAEISRELETAAPHVLSWSQVDAVGPDAFRRLGERCAKTRDWLRTVEGGWLGRVRAQLTDPMLAASWHELIQTAHGERARIMALRTQLVAHTVEIPETGDPQILRLLVEAQRQLGQAGKIGVFARDIKRVMGECRIDGRPAASAQDVALCLARLELSALRRSAVTRWANYAASVQGPGVDAALPEDSLGRHLEGIGAVLNQPRAFAAMNAELTSAGVRTIQQDTADGVDEIVGVCAKLALRGERNQLGSDTADLSQYLDEGARGPQASPAWSEMRAALANADFAAWDAVLDGVVGLYAIARDAQRLADLHRLLAQVAPSWASRIAADPAATGDPVLLPKAWQWRALETWVRSPLQGLNPTQLQSELERLAAQRRRVIGDLVAESAWRRLADNLGDRQRQALNSYLKAMTRFGKTGGKFAARWLAEIRIALNESKDAVPVWIMPKERALGSFRPERTAPFDVLVIDEASQIGLEAVPLLALARTTIVVGDDQQTSPENVGLNRQAVFDLLDDHLADFPKYRTLFDPDNSLYDLAHQKFPDIVMLTEHFRSLPEIIAFSNAHFYDGRVIPLRDRPPHPNWTALGAVKVLDGYRSGDVNAPEAQAVVDLVKRLCADPDYAGMDFGVISLLGTGQAKLIWNLLVEQLGEREMEQRRLRCGEPANFQGDERDVIVLSLVAGTDPANPAARIGALTGTAAQRRINVAASRARNQMWVVHSLDADRFPKGDLRADLIRHCADPMASPAEKLADLAAHCDSDFEREVVQAILARGYRRVRVQHVVGRFRIDIVVDGPEGRLAVECDGDRWHGPDRWHQDRARQEVLERAGWTFERIRGSAFYRDRTAALEPLWRRLDELGIPTGDAWLSAPARSTILEVSAEALDRQVGDGPHGDDPRGDDEHGDEGRGDEAGIEAGYDSGDARTVGRSKSKLLAESAGLNTPTSTSSSGPSIAPPTPASARAAAPGAQDLAPFSEWPIRPLPPVGTTTSVQMINDLVEIAAAEGPVLGQRLFHIYVKASGGHRVGKEIYRVLSDATRLAVRAGRLARLHDDASTVSEATLYVPGTVPVFVRGLGDRQLTEVPRSEVAALLVILSERGHSDADIKRATLDAYGLVRLTAGVSSFLDECLAYECTL
jgi:very-short-patch-repair endonuclease